MKDQRKKVELVIKKHESLNVNATIVSGNLKNFTPESGGTPIRSIVVTTFRSGSSFFLEILQAVPGTFLYFEPLQVISKNGHLEDNQTIAFTKDLLRCKYKYEFTKNKDFLKRNLQKIELCKMMGKNCTSGKFLGQICELFPIQAMKTVRGNLKIMASLLEDKRFVLSRRNILNNI